MSALTIAPQRRQIIAYLATSADGFIARPDGGIDWLERPNLPGDYGMPAFLRTIDTVVMGRKTWETGQRLGGALIDGKRNVVLSRTLAPFAVPGGVVENAPASEIVARFREEKGKNVWLMGGAQVFGEFLSAGAIDQLVVHVIPVLIGVGIPLLDAVPRSTELKLKSTRKFSDGVVRIHYTID